MLVEEGDHLLRMPSEVVVAVFEAFRGVLDPEQFLVLAAQEVEGLLGAGRLGFELQERLIALRRRPSELQI